ncbi:MAG: SHOCT domain-containing protein [Solirubrobacterales bacterium]
MDCFCGCGRKIRRRQTDLNLQASRIALELLAWDKARFDGRLGPPADDDAERVIGRGADRYRRLLETLHGERDDYGLDEGEAWLAESADNRRDREYMTKRGGFLTRDRLLLTDEDHARINRLHPEQSFTGGTAAPAPGEDPVGQLERLGALHAEGVLSDEEFAAAKSRLLRH